MTHVSSMAFALVNEGRELRLGIVLRRSDGSDREVLPRIVGEIGTPVVDSVFFIVAA